MDGVRVKHWVSVRLQHRSLTHTHTNTLIWPSWSTAVFVTSKRPVCVCVCFLPSDSSVTLHVLGPETISCALWRSPTAVETVFRDLSVFLEFSVTLVPCSLLCMAPFIFEMQINKCTSCLLLFSAQLLMKSFFFVPPFETFLWAETCECPSQDWEHLAFHSQALWWWWCIVRFRLSPVPPCRNTRYKHGHILLQLLCFWFKLLTSWAESVCWSNGPGLPGPEKVGLLSQTLSVSGWQRA